MSRERADRIIKGLSFYFNGNSVPLLELVTASYFTENEEFCYGGNTGKNEAVLKVTGKASVARSLVVRRDGNRHIGIIIMGSGTVTRNITELPELINRRSLQYVYILIHIDSDHGVTLLNQCEGANLFACTSDFLRTYASRVKIQNPLCSDLARQVEAIIEHRNESITTKGHLDWSRYKRFKRALLAIKHSDYSDESKDLFVIQAYSMMNLMLTAVFPLSLLEAMINFGQINLVSPAARYEELCALLPKFPAHLKEKAQIAIDIIRELYDVCSDRSEKAERLYTILSKNHNKQVALVVPKAYYADVIARTPAYSFMDDPSNLVISTANKFDNTTVYDLVIAVGDFSGSKFDAFRCRSARHIITLLYEFEANIFKYKQKKAQEVEHMLNQHAVMEFAGKSGIEDIYYADMASDSEVREFESISAEIDDYVTHLNNLAAVRDVSFSMGSSSAISEIIAVATFETGEKALFSKMYEAFVFDKNSGEVNEVKAADLNEGDWLVFTKRNDEASDVVDNVLGKLVNTGKVSSEIADAYLRSKKWKSSLIRYMKKTKSSEGMIADKLIKNGVSVTDATIRRWLDEDARIVGPRDSNSIRQIGFLIGDMEMFVDYEVYFESCKLVKHIRNDIRREIGNAIIKKLQGQTPEQGSIIAEIYDRLDSLTQILRLESIAFVKHTVPTAAANRPFRIKE